MKMHRYSGVILVVLLVLITAISQIAGTILALAIALWGLIRFVWAQRRHQSQPAFYRQIWPYLLVLALVVFPWPTGSNDQPKTSNTAHSRSSRVTQTKPVTAKQTAALKALKIESRALASRESAQDAQSSSLSLIASSQSAASKEARSASKAAKAASESQATAASKAAAASASQQSAQATAQAQSQVAAQDSAQTTAQGDMNTSSQGQIVGNANSKIYHVPGQRGYRMNSANAVYFNTEQDAIAQGYRRSLR